LFTTCIFKIILAAKESAKEITTKIKADSDDEDDDDDNENESRKGNEILNLLKTLIFKNC